MGFFDWLRGGGGKNQRYNKPMNKCTEIQRILSGLDITELTKRVVAVKNTLIMMQTHKPVQAEIDNYNQTVSELKNALEVESAALESVKPKIRDLEKFKP